MKAPSRHLPLSRPGGGATNESLPTPGMPAKDVGPILNAGHVFFPLVIETRLNGFLLVTFSLVAAKPHRVRGLLLFVFFEHDGACHAR
jgi:hypothetical protein